MKATTLLTMASVLVGCSVASEPRTTEDSAEIVDGMESEITAGSAYPTRCSNDGQFALRVTGRGFAGLEGRRVMVAAFENDNDVALDGGPFAIRRVVLHSGSIRNGSFSMSCSRALHQNSGYPTIGVVVDADGDGKCSAGDVAYRSQRYAWAGDLTEDLRPSYFTRVSTVPGSGPFGSAAPFCAGFFE